MTRMFACASGEQFAQAGYTLLSGVPISIALYYFSWLAERTPDFNQYVGNSPQEVYVSSASVSPVTSTFGQQQFQFQNSFPMAGQITSPTYPSSIQWRSFILEAGKPQNQLGNKTWVGTFNQRFENRNDKVIFKLWDSSRTSSRDRDNEVAVYKRLQPLWGVCVPKLVTFGRLAIFHCVVIDYIDTVSPFLGQSLLT